MEKDKKNITITTNELPEIVKNHFRYERYIANKVCIPPLKDYTKINQLFEKFDKEHLGYCTSFGDKETGTDYILLYYEDGDAPDEFIQYYTEDNEPEKLTELIELIQDFDKLCVEIKHTASHYYKQN